MSYKRIDPDQVPIAFQVAANNTAIKAAARLGLPKPRVVWWSGGNRGLSGWIGYDADKRAINQVNLNLDALVDVDHVEFYAAHETRHLWQDANSRYLGREEGEDDANAFAFQFTRKSIKALSGWDAVRIDHIWRL